MAVGQTKLLTFSHDSSVQENGCLNIYLNKLFETGVGSYSF